MCFGRSKLFKHHSVYIMTTRLDYTINMARSSVGYPLLIAGFLASMVFYWLCIVIYRVALSPLAKFPGPKLAAATGWYEGYFDIRKANFPAVLEQLHDKYGKSQCLPLGRTRN